jgi:hypothetical protein
VAEGQPADSRASGEGAAKPTDAEIDAALEALTDPQRLRRAEARVEAIAPQLQHILARALDQGGWFDEAHSAEVLKAATTPDEDSRLTAVRTLLAEETRLGMLVGVAVGWELARELDHEPGEPGDLR